MWSSLPLAVVLILAAPATDYEAEIETWRARREKNLRAEDGWLSVVGLSWLKPGPNAVGSAKGSGVPLPTSAPPRLGTIELKGGVATFRAEPGVDVTVNDKPTTEAQTLRADTAGKPDVVSVGSIRLFVIERGGRLGVRVKDAESPARRAFTGLGWYSVREAYRVTARFVPYAPPKQVPIANVLGQVSPLPSPGYAVFSIGGRQVRLDAVLEEPDAKELFYIFRDGTAGRDTYPAGRFLYSDMPKDGQVVLDFNKAYSPPCAFTDFATCPLPPKQNRLAVRIEAGEKRPRVH